MGKVSTIIYIYILYIYIYILLGTGSSFDVLLSASSHFSIMNMARYSQCWVARTMFFLILYFRSVEYETAISDWMSITLINLWIKIPSIMIHLAIVLSLFHYFLYFSHVVWKIL